MNCLCATEDGRFVVTGGADSLVAVHRCSPSSAVSPRNDLDLPVSLTQFACRLFDNDQRDKCRFATSSKRLCGHGAAVSCCAVSRSYR